MEMREEKKENEENKENGEGEGEKEEEEEKEIKLFHEKIQKSYLEKLDFLKKTLLN